MNDFIQGAWVALWSHIAPLLPANRGTPPRERGDGEERSEHQEGEEAMDDDSEDFARLDDSALLSWRAEARTELERLPPGSSGYAALAARYDRSTGEVNDRARAAWARAS